MLKSGLLGPNLVLLLTTLRPWGNPTIPLFSSHKRIIHILLLIRNSQRCAVKHTRFTTKLTHHRAKFTAVKAWEDKKNWSKKPLPFWFFPSNIQSLLPPTAPWHKAALQENLHVPELTVITSRMLSRLWTLSPASTSLTTTSVPSCKRRTEGYCRLPAAYLAHTEHFRKLNLSHSPRYSEQP